MRTLEDMRRVLMAGAEKVSVDSGAVRNPRIIAEGAKAFGSQCIVLSMQVKAVGRSEAIPSGWEIYVDGARTATGLDAIEWAKRGGRTWARASCASTPSTRTAPGRGYDIPLTRAMAEAVGVPVIASGGGGAARHIAEVCADGKADAAIVASIIHRRETTIPELKQELRDMGVPMRMKW